MRASSRLILTCTAFALLGAVTPAPAADYSVRFGEVRGPVGQRTVAPTNRIKFCDKPSGYRFGYEIVPGDNSAYEYVTVFKLPAPANVKLRDAEIKAGGKEVRTAPKKTQGRAVASYNFDPGDPAGAWKIDVVVNGRVVQTVDFSVVPAEKCP